MWGRDVRLKTHRVKNAFSSKITKNKTPGKKATESSRVELSAGAVLHGPKKSW